MSERRERDPYRRRRLFVLSVLGCGFAALTARAVDLQVLNRDFLQGQGQARHLRVVSMPAHRGMILDRNGEPLAISTPVQSVWVNPQELAVAHHQLPRLAAVLEMEADEVRRLIARRADREFVYLKRHVEPSLAEHVRSLQIPGVYLQQEHRRYYPAGEVAAHVVGFTSIDDEGQEGLELAYDEWLRGEPGAKRVIKDGRRHVVESVESIRAPHPGQDLRLSIDRRVQYLAYRELKAAVRQHGARSGSAVLLDVRRGEVLAMVNQPSFNPNNRSQRRGELSRNRAVTDVFEPGSTLKPFTVAAALSSGRYTPHTPINTSPGFFQVGVNTIKDVRNFGRLDVTGVIRKSSNVGASKIALSMEGKQFWQLLSDTGFGISTGSGFPGEASGLLAHHHRWGDIETATLAFGYGISVTPLQLAQAYAVLAGDGVALPVSFLVQEEPPRGRRVLSPRVAAQVRSMLEEVVGPQGTAPLARVAGYRVGGKTGTVKKSVAGGYADDRHLALFAGMAPLSNPRLVLVVVVDEPRGEAYYGGEVAAPVFANIMAGALRLLNVAPDDLPLLHTRRHGTEEPA
jgi:cell division protein FtsI (penicillin-binding protein 3)